MRSIVGQHHSRRVLIVLMLILLLLSSAILPSWKLLAAQALIVVASAILLRRSFTKLYSKAQFALQETLATPPAPRHEVAARTLPSILRDAELATISLPQDSEAVGQLIGGLRLRTRTGASIVGIQRNGSSIINPGPDEELKTGDEILLLGSAEQLASAQALLEP